MSVGSCNCDATILGNHCLVRGRLMRSYGGPLGTVEKSDA